MFDNRHLTSDNWHQMSDIKHLKSDTWSQTPDIRCLILDLMSDVQCLIFDVRCLMSNFDAKCLMSDVQCRIFNVQWLKSDVQCPTSNVSCLISISDCRCLKFNAWLRSSEAEVRFRSSLPSCIKLRLIYHSFQYQWKGKWSILQWPRPNNNKGAGCPVL